ncbi:molybdenum cofactor guanylyltransferase [Jatrophihabitans fulvus]
MEPGFDAIVLAGGRGRRLGGADKPGLDVGGTPLLARVVEAARGAHTVVVVGPERSLDLDVRWCREEPPGSGPVAALAAALPLTTAPRLTVLAADLPWIAPAVPLLLAAVPAGGRASLIDADGRENRLASAWERAALEDALARLPTTRDASMRSLADGVPLTPVPDTGGWGDDCDTWDDVARARARAQDTNSSPA